MLVLDGELSLFVGAALAFGKEAVEFVVGGQFAMLRISG